MRRLSQKEAELVIQLFVHLWPYRENEDINLAVNKLGKAIAENINQVLNAEDQP